VSLLFTRANFLRLMESTEGTPYKFGGNQPFDGGADCSGDVQWAAEQCVDLEGNPIKFPRTTDDEWADLDRVADPTLTGMQPGDLPEMRVPGDGGEDGWPDHVGVALGNGVMVDDPHTGAVVRVEEIPNIPGVIFPIGYVRMAFLTEPAPPPSSDSQEVIIMGGIPTGCTDQGAVREHIREEWNEYHTDSMTEAEENLFLFCFYESTANGGYGGNPDSLDAAIVDEAKERGTLRPDKAGSV
jgi:hypothetical protein